MAASTEMQAAMLAAVASHLTSHPHLYAVNILSDDRVQLRTTSTPGRGLVAWADTLTDARADVQVIHCADDELWAFVYVVGYLGDRELTVWDVVPGLAEAMNAEAGHVVITLDDLRAYSEDGTAPVPAGSVAPA